MVEQVVNMVGRSLASIEVERYDWSSLAVCGGSAQEIPRAVEAMLASSDADEVERYYWQLENRAVVQGQLYSAAPPLVSVLIAGLQDKIARPARIGALELLYQLITGTSHPEEAASHPALGEECQERAREGIWIFYRELTYGESDAAKDVLEVIENDAARLHFFLGQLEKF
jgi:hypothetical protein